MGERDLVTGIVQLANLLNRRLTPVFQKANITPQQWSLLVTVASVEEPLTLAGLGRNLAVSKQNITGMIRRLEDLGLVERSGGLHDRRTQLVGLTRRGRAVVEKARPAYELWRDALGGELTERDLLLLTRSINQLIALLEQP